MKQYTDLQVARFQKKLAEDNRILAILDEAIQPVRQHYRIPETAIATWGGFFACPTHSVNLTFDISNPDFYCCPVDGERFSGPPYEGAWWRLVNGANEEACHFAALRYMLLNDPEDLALARNILVDYAKRYPSYEIHGDIPYNKPGKANAQVLCDAQWIKHLASGYDIIRDQLSAEDRQLIETDLFHCAAAFLMEYRTAQLHNHECVVNASIGILGLLLDHAEYLDFAVNAPYGFLYQLEHAVLTDGFWFEGTPSYHFYAMRQFVDLERFVQAGQKSFFDLPHFRRALKFPMVLAQPDRMLTPLNDAGNNSRYYVGAEYLYELAYAATGDEDYLRLLHLAYADKPRVNIHAFFDGVDALPPIAPRPMTNYHGGGKGASGITILHGKDDRFLLVKHSPYGGEHDHYDRLGLHFMAYGYAAVPDIGTTQYGAPLHYAYYKNTLPHNTVCLNGENQPPAACLVREYTAKADCTVLDVSVCWDGSHPPLDSFTVVQWNEDVYRNAFFRRHITWYSDFFIDCFDVHTPSEKDIDWVLHVRGERLPTASTATHPTLYTHGPGQYMHSFEKCHKAEAILPTTWRISPDVFLTTHTLTRGSEAFYALGPDNPSVRDIPYLIQRTQGTQARFINVICAHSAQQPVIQSVTANPCGLTITLDNGQVVEYAFPKEIE